MTAKISEARLTKESVSPSITLPSSTRGQTTKTPPVTIKVVLTGAGKRVAKKVYIGF